MVRFLSDEVSDIPLEVPFSIIAHYNDNYKKKLTYFVVRFICSCLSLFPCIRSEQQQYREKFKSAGKHIEDQNYFCRVGEYAEIRSRTDKIKTRTDVVHSGGNCGEIRDKVEIVK